MNRSVIVGRLTKDVDLRYTQNGKAVGTFTLAVNRPFKNKQTNDFDADFINCVAWGKQAENLAQYMKKGSQVGVDGRIQTRTYDDRDGKTVYITEVVADNIQFLESRKDNDQNSKQQQENNPFESNAEPIDIDDSDLPF